MSRSFEFPIQAETDVPALLRRAQAKAAEAGIEMEGDASGGHFEGTADGTFRVSDGVLHLDVSRKPAFVPWSMIESQLRKAFSPS